MDYPTFCPEACAALEEGITSMSVCGSVKEKSMVTAKFRCDSVKFNTQPKDGENVKSSEVVQFGASGDQEWSRYTPSGRIEMTITNEACWGRFVSGKDYMLTFTEAE